MRRYFVAESQGNNQKTRGVWSLKFNLKELKTKIPGEFLVIDFRLGCKTLLAVIRVHLKVSVSKNHNLFCPEFWSLYKESLN